MTWIQGKKRNMKFEVSKCHGKRYEVSTFDNTKYAENVKQRLFKAEGGLEKSFVTNKLCPCDLLLRS